MSNLEMKVDALMRYCTAQDTVTQTKAREDMQALLVTKSSRTRDTEQVARQILLELGMPMNIRGHKYNLLAVNLAVRNPEILEKMCKELYPKVAAITGSTPCRVERAIRHAIEVAWSRGDLEVIQRCFGNTVSPDKGKPTNGEFIARVAQMVRERTYS